MPSASPRGVRPTSSAHTARDASGRYAREVRLEYAHVPAATFAQKRTAVLRHFAAAPRLFFGELGEELDERARANLAAEIMRLERRTARPN